MACTIPLELLLEDELDELEEELEELLDELVEFELEDVLLEDELDELLATGGSPTQPVNATHPASTTPAHVLNNRRLFILRYLFIILEISVNPEVMIINAAMLAVGLKISQTH